MNGNKWLRVAILMILVLTVAVGCAKKQVETQPEPAEPAEVSTMKQEEAQDMAAQKAAEEREAKERAAKQAKMEAMDTLTMENIYFDFDKYDLKPQYRDLLKEKAEILKKYDDTRVLIAGHCDERGTEEYNLALGERRARAAYEFLVLLGVNASQLEMVSYGEERPAVQGSNESAWAKNRRDEFKIIK
jgi:peptidoglycan-associated lipoprotein